MSRFKNKTAIVTGGASGIGKAISAQLINQGATVLIADIAGAPETAEKLGCQGIRLDVTDKNAVASCIEEFTATEGRLDYIFNNAGVVAIGDAQDMAYDDWMSMLDVNIKGVVNGVYAAYPIMINQGFGSIVNTASVAGLVPTPGSVPYCASKYAVVGLSNSLRAEAKRYGVNVNAICPGFIETPMRYNSKLVSGTSRDKMLSAVDFAGGWTTPDDMASAALKGVIKNKPVIIAPTRMRIMVNNLRRFPVAGEMLVNVMAGIIDKTKA